MAKPEGEGPSGTQGEDPVMVGERQRLRSAAARRILLEAVEETEISVDDIESLATWERRAQEVVSIP